jgi:hypothetical protein
MLFLHSFAGDYHSCVPIALQYYLLQYKLSPPWFIFVPYVCSFEVHAISSVRFPVLLCSSNAYSTAETWQHNPLLPAGHLQNALVGLSSENKIQSGRAALLSILGLTKAFNNLFA